MDGNESFGRLLHRLRKARDLTQEALAQQVYCATDTIKKIEMGLRRPSRQLAAQLADCLGLTGDERAAFLTAARAEQVIDQLDVTAQPLNQPPGALGPTAAPSGTVIFLFTDIAGSTVLWEHYPQAMRAALARHDTILRQQIEAHGGHVFKTVGDAVYAAFATAPDALLAALQAQRALQVESWDSVRAPANPQANIQKLQSTLDVRVRMVLHTGAADIREGDYFGPPLNRAARLLAATHGGQVLLSLATEELVREELPADVTLRDLGEHRLKDLTHPEQIFQVVAPGLPSDFPPLRTLETRGTNLPVQPNALIGREHEIIAVRVLLRRADVHLVTLTGSGGVGKTRLALQIAAEVLEDFAHGAYVVALAPISDPNLVIPTIAQTLGVREASGQPLLESLKDHLRARQQLLLLDNFEQVLDAAPQVAELVAACPQLKLLITSREVLHLYGERDVLVPPLALPPREPRTTQRVPARRVNREPYLDQQDQILGSRFSVLPSTADLTQYEAVRLFSERAQAVKPEFAVTNQNAPAVAEICARLDGLPLAIELAAARVGLFPPEALLARLRSPLKVLTGGPRDRPARQQTLNNTIDWSYHLLSSGEQALFARLGVFVGGCTLDAADAVCNADGDLPFEAVDGITSLLDKSLLRQIETADDQPRVTMLETIRAYALQRLERSAGADALRQRHASYFCIAFHGHEAELVGGLPSAAVDEIAADIDNIRAAWQWAVDHDDLACLQHALESLFSFYNMRGMAAEGMSAFGRAIDRLSVGVAGEPTPQRTLALGRLLVRQGWLLWRTNLLGSFETIQRGLALLEAVELDTRAERASALGDLSWFYYISGDPEQAEASVTNGLALARAVGSDGLVANLLMTRGQILEFQGEARAAAEQFRASVAVYDNTDDLEGRASALNNWGRAAYAMGEYAQARRLIEDALYIRRRSDERYGISYSLLDLGRLAEFAGDYVQARELIGQSMAVAEQLQSGDHSARAYVALGAVAHAEGEFDEAENYFQRALKFWRDHRVGRGPALCLNGLAEVALDRGDIARARAYFEESLTIAQQLKNVGEAAVAELGLGRVALGLGAPAQAAAHLRRALKIAERTGAAPLALDALIVLAQLVSSGESTRIEQTIEFLALATTHPAARHATRARAARLLDAVITTPPPEVAQAAQARGQALDLWATAGELLVELEAARWATEEAER